MAHMRWVRNDNGRAAAGFRGHAGDCVARSVATERCVYGYWRRVPAEGDR